MKDPTATFADTLRLDDDTRPIDLIAAPSETDDALVLWLPEQRILLGGAATPRGNDPERRDAAAHAPAHPVWADVSPGW